LEWKVKAIYFNIYQEKQVNAMRNSNSDSDSAAAAAVKKHYKYQANLDLKALR
jgi:hypothetical protein